MLNNNYVVKEYYDLNGYYLKVTFFNGDIYFVSYNSNLLNGIKYETKITSAEIMNKVQNKNFSSFNLYELILKKIEERKYIINSDQSYVSILILETSSIFNQINDLKIVIPKNSKLIVTEYEKVLSREIINLREENKKLWSEIYQIKNKYSTGSKPLSKVQTSPRDSIGNINNINNNLRLSKSIQITQPKGDASNSLTTQEINIKTLSDLKFPNYPTVLVSQKPSGKIIAYGANSYYGIARDHNEDRLKIILEHNISKSFPSNGKTISQNISYFAIYDGHGGNKCVNFIQENLHNYLFQSEFFPSNPLKSINDAFEKAELNYELISLDKQNKKLIDKSGSCAVSALVMGELCYITYLGDSRGLYSYDSGNQLFQITRDHKPNDIKEKTRIENAGGKIYKDTRLKVNGLKIKVNEKDAPGVKFPYRVTPGNLSVRLLFLLIIYLIL